jgi:hypothetical protein
MSEWDELSKSTLPDASRDVPLGYCWHCRRRIDVGGEVWRLLPHDLMAHVDCETLWGDSPAMVQSRRAYEEQDDLAGYFEELEELVRSLHGHRYVTEPRLQVALDARLERLSQWALHELLGADNPWRQPGEGPDEYHRRRVLLDEDDEDDAEEEV